MRTLKAWLGLVRVGNSVVIGLAAVTGYVVVGGTDILRCILLFLGALLVGAGGNVINDYYDRFIDSVNKPWRPIPSGVVKAEMAKVGLLSPNVSRRSRIGFGLPSEYRIGRYCFCLALFVFLEG